MAGLRRAGSWYWFGWITLLILSFVVLTAHNIEHFPPLRSDEIWNMSVSYKLATSGVLGTDLLAGFHNADRVYFINLPLMHLVQAFLFRSIGVTLLAVRLPSLFGGCLLLAAVSQLARRWHGWPTAVLAGLLILFWRSDITLNRWRVPLAADTRNGRYDLLVVALVWLAVFFLDRTLRRPRALTAWLTGVTAGLGVLTQFVGVFFFPLAGVAFLWRWRRRAWREAAVIWFAIGAAVVLIPLFIYGVANRTDFAGQSLVWNRRGDFDQPTFYIDNLRRESRRYQWLLQSEPWNPQRPLQQPLGPWLLIIGAAPVLLLSFYWVETISRPPDVVGRARSETAWLGPGSAVLFLAQLAFLEQTKAPVYTLVLVPSLCITFAHVGVRLSSPILGGKAPRGRRTAVWQSWKALPVSVLLAMLVVEGWAAYRNDIWESNRVTPYAAIGTRIRDNLAPAVTVMGAERWWWALHERPYLSHTGLFVRWREKRGEGDDVGTWYKLLEQAAIDAVVVNSNVIGDLSYQPSALQAAFNVLLERCATRTIEWVDRNYGPIKVVHLSLHKAGCEPPE